MSSTLQWAEVHPMAFLQHSSLKREKKKVAQYYSISLVDNIVSKWLALIILGLLGKPTFDKKPIHLFIMICSATEKQSASAEEWRAPHLASRICIMLFLVRVSQLFSLGGPCKSAHGTGQYRGRHHQRR